MKKSTIIPLDERIHFDDNEIIVSKTNTKGIITYANDIFCRVAEMQTKDVIGQPHNIIRHPDMPRAVFKLLWDHLKAEQEIFAYVKNMSATGKYYWVIAHVSPSYDQHGKLAGYHSNRRAPTPAALARITDFYHELREIERNNSDRKSALDQSYGRLKSAYSDNGLSYDEYIWQVGAGDV